MSERDEQYTVEIDLLLKRKLIEMIAIMEMGEPPTADICDEVETLLDAYFEQLGHTHFEPISRYDIQILRSNFNRMKKTTTGILNELKRDKEAVEGLFQAGLHKAILVDDTKSLQTLYNRLELMGYIDKIVVKYKDMESELYTLSENGRRCIQTQEIWKELAEENLDTYPLPSIFVEGVEKWSPIMYFRALLIQRYSCDKDEQKNSIIFSFPDYRELLFGCMFNDSEGIQYLCPMVYEDNIQKDACMLLKKVIEDDEVEKVILLFVTEQEEIEFRKECLFHGINMDKLAFVVCKGIMS